MSKEQQQRRWTSDEDAMLLRGFQQQVAAPKGKGGTVNWNEIAKKIPGRTNKDCRKRYYNNMAAGLKKGPWTEEEDSRLRSYIEECGLSWAVIAQKIGNRSADQCSKRWHHCLDPGLERQAWTEEESQRLLAAVATHGTTWKDIQMIHFPTRSANNVKNQYSILGRKYASTPLDLPPCCALRQQNPPRTPSNHPESCEDSNLPPDNAYGLTVVDSDLSTPESTDSSCLLLLNECRSPDLDFFLDDLPSSDFPDPWGMSGTTDLDDFLNTALEPSSAGLDMQYFPTSSPVAETAFGMGRGELGEQALCHDTNHPSRLHSQMPHSSFSQTNSTNVPYFIVADDKEAALAQAGGVSRQDMAVSGSRLIITIDDAEPDTVMGVMKVLVASKAKVNFQST